MERSLKILLLEDNIDDAEIVKFLLLKEKLDCEFSLAIDKETYLQALDEFLPDIILSDHSLPQFNAVEALAIARQRFPDIPFIMVTGMVSEQFAADIIKSGADDYVVKDRMARLPAAINTAIQWRRSEKEKREAEQKIIQSETNLRTIFENTSEGFLLMDKNAVIMAFNHKAEVYTFFSKSKRFQVGESIYDFIEESRKEFFRGIIARVLKGENIQYDRSYQIKNGTTIWIDFSATPVIEAGQVQGICIAGRNITEKKIIEQEREFDRNNLKALINNTNDLMWSVDRDFKLITSNEAFDKVVKAMSGQTVAKGSIILASGFTPEQLDRFRNYYQRAFSGESFTVIEHTDFPDNFWSEISFYPIHYGERIIGAACFSHDITGKKKAEEDLRHSEMRLNEAQAIAHISNWEVDLVQNIYTWSDECYRIYGLNKSETQPSAELFLSFMHPDDADFVQKKIQEAFTSFRDSSFEFRFIRKDGLTRHGYTEWRFEFDKKGKTIRLFGILQDITERKEAEENLKLLEQKILEQKIQEQKKIARAIIKAQEKERNHIGQELHDNINQILASIKMNLESGVKNGESKEVIKYSLELVNSCMQEIRSLSSTLVTPLKNINLKDLMQRLLDDIKNNTAIKTKFEYNLSDLAIGDDLKLNIYRIIQEQLNNIVKHAEAKNLDVSICVANGFISILVADDGKGFDVNQKRKGIGISNMINRVESFNGKVTIESSPGNGSRISFKIPC